MNGHLLFELNWPELVYWLADHVHHAPERTRTNGNRNWPTLIDGFHAAHHAVGRLHCDAAHAPFAEMLLHFEDDVDGCGHLKPLVDNLECFINRRHRRFGELHVDGRPSDLNYMSDVFWHKTSATVLPLRSQSQ